MLLSTLQRSFQLAATIVAESTLCGDCKTDKTGTWISKINNKNLQTEPNVDRAVFAFFFFILNVMVFN